MSKCFAASVVAMSSDEDLDLDALVGTPVTLVLDGATRRTLRGVCLSADQARAEEEGLSAYELTIGPSMSLLAHRSRYRVFSHKSTPDIVDLVLREWGIVSTWQIDRARHLAAPLRVQAGESDLAFVSRLLEEAGIAFTFPTEDAEEDPEVLFSDASWSSDRLFAVAHNERPTRGQVGPYARNVKVGRRLRAGRVVLADHHFRLRRGVALTGEAVVKGQERFEQHKWLAGSSVAEMTSAGDPTPAADARGAERPDAKLLARRATEQLERERGRRREVAFETNVDALRPGVRVRLEGHPREEVREGTMIVTELRTSGSVTESVSLAVRALFLDVPYHPALETPKPRAYGVHTATVVGPAGEEVHTDEFGRVLVQFAWDREHAFDEGSSCWLRVSQGWAGGGHASFALPRVGDEVLVGFIDGDPDQPVIVGRVHNAAAPVPYRLPASKTISTWRSASVPATGGFNEIRFEDAAGREVLAMQAERDRQILVKNADLLQVGTSRAIQVGTSRTATIGTTDEATVGERFAVTVGDGATATTRIESTSSRIVLTTGQASIILDGPNIHLDAPGEVVVKGAGRVRVESLEADVVVQGGPMVRINPRGAGEHPEGETGQVPFDFPDGQSATDFDDAIASYASRAFFDPTNPTYLEEATRKGGELDPTPRGAEDDGLRAFKYAVACRAVGLPEGVVVRRAGALNRKANGASAGKGDPGNGVFGGEAPYGNDDAQLDAMKKGFDFYDATYAEQG